MYVLITVDSTCTCVQVKLFVAELEKGLAAPGQTIKGLPSYVTRLPNGHEQGTFLALDLGGTNLRVCEVVLEGNGKFRMYQSLDDYDNP
jgi:hexokinase